IGVQQQRTEHRTLGLDVLRHAPAFERSVEVDHLNRPPEPTPGGQRPVTSVPLAAGPAAAEPRVSRVAIGPIRASISLWMAPGVLREYAWRRVRAPRRCGVRSAARPRAPRRAIPARPAAATNGCGTEDDFYLREQRWPGCDEAIRTARDDSRSQKISARVPASRRRRDRSPRGARARRALPSPARSRSAACAGAVPRWRGECW